MPKNVSRSFTLIEFLISFAIVGILIGIILVIINTRTTVENAIIRANSFDEFLKQSKEIKIISEYKFDGFGVADGNTANINYIQDTGNQKNGIVTPNLPTVLTGDNCISGSCLNFDRIQKQCITVPDNPALNVGSRISAMMWVKQNIDGSYALIGQGDDAVNLGWEFFSNHGFLDLYLYDDGTGVDDHWAEYYAYDNKILDNQWHLVGFSWDSGALKMYVDGKSVDYTVGGKLTTNSINDTATDLTIGCLIDNGNKDHFFTGQMDDVRLYNTAISITQAQEQYRIGLEKLFSLNQITKEELQIRTSKT